ncbi:hypothetical protein DBV15_00815 [Temnothorax longispinosus]|uniref:Uncharacterized protein n=1 Tax=Temnothorax longispinosus TaxID=300112 RepID=A0A4S2KKF0_9HYME|nr:hypothetical protein DBV15_00815 [Temnothorax longispinosus]
MVDERTHRGGNFTMDDQSLKTLGELPRRKSQGKGCTPERGPAHFSAANNISRTSMRFPSKPYEREIGFPGKGGESEKPRAFSPWNSRNFQRLAIAADRAAEDRRGTIPRRLLPSRRVGAVVAPHARTSTKPALRRIYTSPPTGMMPGVPHTVLRSLIQIRLESNEGNSRPNRDRSARNSRWHPGETLRTRPPHHVPCTAVQPLSNRSPPLARRLTAAAATAAVCRPIKSIRHMAGEEIVSANFVRVAYTATVYPSVRPSVRPLSVPPAWRALDQVSNSSSALTWLLVTLPPQQYSWVPRAGVASTTGFQIPEVSWRAGYRSRLSVSELFVPSSAFSRPRWEMEQGAHLSRSLHAPRKVLERWGNVERSNGQGESIGRWIEIGQGKRRQSQVERKEESASTRRCHDAGRREDDGVASGRGERETERERGVTGGKRELRENRRREIDGRVPTTVETTFRCPMRKPLRRRCTSARRTDAKSSSPLDGLFPAVDGDGDESEGDDDDSHCAASRLSKLGSNTRVAGCRLSDGRTRGAAAPCVDGGGGGGGDGGGGEPSHPPCRDAPTDIPTSRAARLVVRAAGPTAVAVVAPVYTPSGTITTYRTLLGIFSEGEAVARGGPGGKEYTRPSNSPVETGERARRNGNDVTTVRSEYPRSDRKSWVFHLRRRSPAEKDRDNEDRDLRALGTHTHGIGRLARWG